MKAVDICERTAKVLTAHSQRALPGKIRLSQTPAHGNTKHTRERRRRRRRQTQFRQQKTPTNMCSSVWPVFLWGIFLDHICGFLFTEHVLLLPLISFGESSWTIFVAFYSLNMFSFCLQFLLGSLLGPHFWLFIILFSPLCPLDISSHKG